MAEMKNHSLHRALSGLNKGGLHRALHVPEGTEIPKEKVEEATRSDNKHVAAMARFAQNMAGWKK
jgi:hypothetical protein